MKTTTAEREEAVAALRNAIKPGDVLYTVLRGVSRSGMLPIQRSTASIGSAAPVTLSNIAGCNMSTKQTQTFASLPILAHFRFAEKTNVGCGKYNGRMQKINATQYRGQCFVGSAMSSVLVKEDCRCGYKQP